MWMKRVDQVDYDQERKITKNITGVKSKKCIVRRPRWEEEKKRNGWERGQAAVTMVKMHARSSAVHA